MRNDAEEGRGGEGARLQREVLAMVLVEQPLRLTLADLRHELEARGRVDLAVAALIDDGLLALEGEEVVPTPAAVHFNRLEPMEPPTDA